MRQVPRVGFFFSPSHSLVYDGILALHRARSSILCKEEVLVYYILFNYMAKERASWLKKLQLTRGEGPSRNEGFGTEYSRQGKTL